MKRTAKKNNILVGVCGGISAYKTCGLVRLLKKSKYQVKVLMTESATRFVTPLTFQTLSENPVYIDMWRLQNAEEIKHISLSQWADIAVLAPASANTISKIANGICDNLLATVICAVPSKTKVILAPAMNKNMWKNPFIRENVEKLQSLSQYEVLNPGKGMLACGVYGEGRMPEVEDIFRKIEAEARGYTTRLPAGRRGSMRNK